MITAVGYLKKARQERRTILQKFGLEKVFRKLSKKFRREFGDNTEIFIYYDTCPEMSMDMFTAEVMSPMPDGLLFCTANSDIHEIINRLEEYINE